MMGPWMKVMYRKEYMVDKLKCLKDYPKLIFDNHLVVLNLLLMLMNQSSLKRCMLAHLNMKHMKRLSLLGEDF